MQVSVLKSSHHSFSGFVITEDTLKSLYLKSNKLVGIRKLEISLQSNKGLLVGGLFLQFKYSFQLWIVLYLLMVNNFLRHIMQRTSRETCMGQNISCINVSLSLIFFFPTRSQMATYKAEACFMQAKSN